MSLDKFNAINTTNLRIIVGVALEAAFGVTMLYILVHNIKVDHQTVYETGGFIIAVLGLGVTQYGIKRKTFKPEVHQAPTETAPAGEAPTVVEPDVELPYEAKDG